MAHLDLRNLQESSCLAPQPSLADSSLPNRIVIATDAWQPQVNGVQRTLERTMQELTSLGKEVMIIEPGQFRTFTNPLYPEVRIALPSARRISKTIQKFEPDAIHISTEGSVGFFVRRFCRSVRWPFSTGFHTMWPDYLNRLAKLPEEVTWAALRWFHRPAHSVMVPTLSMIQRLKSNKIEQAKLWSRGVDGSTFCPQERRCPDDLRPILTYVGRVSIEKNIEAFLKLQLPRELCGQKVVVGDGPLLETLKAKYPSVSFIGKKTGNSLAQCYSESDVLVFPSLTDTFGNVITESLACGTPVAAFPVTGPKDIITSPEFGCLHDDLSVAITTALKSGNRSACARYVRENFTWDRATRQFLGNLAHRPN